MASFFYCGHLSSAQLDRWQAPKQRPIIDQRPVEQTAFQREIKDLVTRHRSWIKGLGQNPQKEWTRSLLAVPFVRGHPTVTPGTPRNDGVYTRQSPWHGTRQTGIVLNSQKTKEIVFDFQRNQKEIEPVAINGIEIEIVTEHKYLGTNILTISSTEILTLINFVLRQTSGSIFWGNWNDLILTLI